MNDYLKKRTWTGRWIEPEQENAYREPELSFEQMVEAENSGVASESHLKCGRHLRRILDIENAQGELPVKAVIHASAHGVYDLYINGVKADKRLLAPETTDYEKLIWYQTYDITSLIMESSRVCIDVLLGDGWWIGRLGMGGSSCNYGDRLGFIMDLELTYPDGEMQVTGSDEQFLSTQSFIRYSDLYIGEMQDLTMTDAENEWTPCMVTKDATDILAQQPTPGICVIKELPLAEYVKNPDNDLVADFGQVIAGVVRIRVKAEAGTLITVEHAEVLDREGNYHNNIKGLYKDQKDRYICRGGEEVLIPHFTYHGFRYVRISGISRENILELSALAIGTPLTKLGSFETDNVLINRLQQAIENSTTGNMISVPTDCPQREKLGWTGDINIFTGTGAFLYDLRNFLDAWLLQVRTDQFPDGEIPVVVPNHPCQDQMQRGMSGGTNSSAAWSDCIILIPLKLYQIYGDRHFLEDNLTAMERWMEYVGRQAENDLWTGRFHFGDWLIPSLKEEPDGVMRGVMATSDITGSCYYALAARGMAEICRILDLPEKEAHWMALYERIRKAVFKAYVYEDGRVGVHAAEHDNRFCEDEPDIQLQGLYVLVLACGAVEGTQQKALMLRRLADMIEEADCTLDCGFSSIGYLLDVLYENGYKELAYRILFGTKAPSWLYMAEHGATTIWENWRAIREDGTVTDSSYNHYAYGCVGDFMYRHVGGIEALDTDCGLRRSSCCRTLPDEQDFSVSDSGTEGAGKRKICVSWELDDNNSGHLHVVIPEGVSAVIVLPDEEKEAGAGTYDHSF